MAYMTSADKESLFRVKVKILHFTAIRCTNESLTIKQGTRIKVNFTLTAVFTSDAVVLLCQFSQYIMSMTLQKQTAV